MIRLLYALTVIPLIGGTAWAASGGKTEGRHANGQIGFVLIAALQR